MYSLLRYLLLYVLLGFASLSFAAENAMDDYFVDSPTVCEGNSFAKNCTKGCACGATCISCNYTCHVPTTTYTPPITYVPPTAPVVATPPKPVIPQYPISSIAYAVDGDTLDIDTPTGKFRIRLANIDAPERTQSYGLESKQCLLDIVRGKTLTYASKGKDQYGRTLAQIFANGQDVSAEMVLRGCAMVYDQYNDDDTLPPIQSAAKNNHIGLWADASAIAPWIFRHPDTVTPTIERVASWAEYKYPTLFRGNAATSTSRWVWPDSNAALALDGSNRLQVQSPDLGFKTLIDIGEIEYWLGLAAQDGF